MAPSSNVPSSNKNKYTVKLHEFYISLNTTHVEIADFFCLEHFPYSTVTFPMKMTKDRQESMVHGVQPGTEVSAHGIISLVDPRGLFIRGVFFIAGN